MGDEADRSAFPILIVDDQERNLIALESVLRNVHGPVIRASSGEQALALSLRHRFALAILDVQMPGMDGYELAELLVGERTADPLPIIFVTAAYADDDHRARGYTSGAVDYLLKPIEPAILLAKVKVFVELARARAEIERLLSQQTQSLAIKSGQLTRKAAFQAMLSTSTTSLVGREAADPFAGVRDTLEAVATHLGATHASAHVVRANSIGVQVAIEREPLVAASTAGTLGARLMALLGARLAHGEAVLLPSFAVLAENERTALEMLGVRALLILPAIGPEQRLAGSVTFSWGGSTRTPVPDLVDVAEHLALLPTMICAAIERIESERERSNAVAQKGVLFETMSQGVIYCDVAGNVLAMNGMATRILGPDAAECFGHSASTSRFEFTDQAGAPLAAADLPWARAARTCQTVSNVVVGVMHPTWSAKRWLIIDAVPIFQAGQATPYQVYLVFSDFEALRRATEAIRRADDAEAESRKKSDILASVSHEIRTPLNACLGYTKLLLRDPTLRGKQREYLQAIDRSGSHLVTLVNNVLDMARAEAGEGISDPVDADPKDVLEMIEQMFRLRAEEKGLALAVAPASPLPKRITADVGRITQILINLVGNAVKFTSRGGIEVRLTASPLEGGRAHLRFTVADTGVGIPEADRANIFQAFVQVSAAARRVGTGLGLAVSQRYARLMGGDLWMQPNDGGGSVFGLDVAVPAEFPVYAPCVTATELAGPVVAPAVRLALPLPRRDALLHALKHGYVEDIQRELAACAAVVPAELGRELVGLGDRYEFAELSRLLDIEAMAS